MRAFGPGPIPVTNTAVAFGARTRNVTDPSADTSGDFTAGMGPRPPGPRPGAFGAGAFCPQTDSATNKQKKTAKIIFTIDSFWNIPTTTRYATQFSAAQKCDP